MIVDGRKNFSGTAEENLGKPYEHLELEKDSMTSLSDKKWHIKARGIHELCSKIVFIL